MGCTLTTEEVAHIDRTIADLKDENARLRSCLSDDAENARMIMAENAKLRETLQRRSEQLDGMTEMWVERGVENAKLRELVEDMAAEIRGLGVDFKRVGWCDYADRMRELGVEVE